MDLISSNDMISIHAASDISIIQNSAKVRLVLWNDELAAYGIVIAWEKKHILMLYSIEKHCVGVYFILWPLTLQFHLLIFDMLSNACQILSCIWFVEMMVRIPKQWKYRLPASEPDDRMKLYQFLHNFHGANILILKIAASGLCGKMSSSTWCHEMLSKYNHFCRWYVLEWWTFRLKSHVLVWLYQRSAEEFSCKMNDKVSLKLLLYYQESGLICAFKYIFRYAKLTTGQKLFLLNEQLLRLLWRFCSVPIKAYHSHCSCMKNQIGKCSYQVP